MADALYPITVPKWGIEMQEGTITGWQVNVGASVQKGDELIDIETDKIVNTMEAPVGGVVCRQLVDEGETLKVGELLGVIATADASDDEIDAFVRDFVPADASFGIEDEAEPAAPVADDAAAAESGSVRASPVAKRLAKKLGIDLATVKGTGRNGRISKEDVEAAAQGSVGAEVARTPMSSRRQTIARRLTASMQDIPHYYLTRTIDIERALSAKGPDASLNAFIVKACADALAEHGNVNVHVHDDGIEYRDAVDINVAVDTDQGLSAPLIRGADRMSHAELTAAIADLGERARSNTLSSADLELGGFTVSNLGSLGIESFTAIINPPQAAILAVGAVYRAPVMQNNVLAEEAARIRVTLSCDHRVIDGADGARFLQTLAEKLN